MLKIYKKGDVDAALGVFFDGFSKIIIGSSVLIGIMKIPEDFVFSRLIAGLGFTALIFLLFNTFLAKSRARKTNNLTLTALPGGIVSGSFFIWLFAIMMPVYLSTNDYILAWKVGLWANIFHSLFNILSAFIIDKLLKRIPSPAIFSSLAGGAMAWLLISALADGFTYPIVIMPALFILLTIYFAKIDLKIPAAIIAILVSTIIAWIFKIMDFNMVIESTKNLGFYFPLPSFTFLSLESLKLALKFLPIVIAFAFADVIGAIQSHEQAKGVGDIFNRRTLLLTVGCSNIIGAIFGNPFIIGYFWGQPAWKKGGATTTYPSLVGLTYFILCITGLVSITTAILPSSATVVLIIYVGLNSISQAFSSNDKKYYPAMALGLAIPVFELIWNKVNSATLVTKDVISKALVEKNIDFNIKDIPITLDKLNDGGIAKGFFALSSGSMLIAILYVSIFCYIIDRKWLSASIAFLMAAFSSFIGLIHSGTVGFNLNKEYTIMYVLFAFIAFLFSRSKRLNDELKIEKL